MTIDNLIIDRVLEGTFYKKSTGEGLFRLTQIQNASLSNESETVDVLDNTGVLITQLDRSKSATFSGENALKDMHLLAAQAGTELETGSATKKIVVPAFDVIDVVAGTTAYTLKHDPIATPTCGYVLTAGGALGKKIVVESAAGEDKVAVSGKDVTVVLTTDDAAGTCKAGESIMFMYDYEEENAVQLVNKADQFNVPMRAVFACLAYEPCAIDDKIYVMVEFPSVKLSSTFDFSLSAEEAQAFELQCMVDYCSNSKELYRVIVVDGED